MYNIIYTVVVTVIAFVCYYYYIFPFFFFCDPREMYNFFFKRKGLFGLWQSHQRVFLSSIVQVHISQISQRRN